MWCAAIHKLITCLFFNENVTSDYKLNWNIVNHKLKVALNWKKSKLHENQINTGVHVLYSVLTDADTIRHGATLSLFFPLS